MKQECQKEQTDLGLLQPVLQQYAKTAGSLITILQKTQDIYGYLPLDALVEIKNRVNE